MLFSVSELEICTYSIIKMQAVKPLDFKNVLDLVDREILLMTLKNILIEIQKPYILS